MAYETPVDVLQEHLDSPTLPDLSDLLLRTSADNRDPVTDFYFETKGGDNSTRSFISQAIERLAKSEQQILFFQIDLDRLKKLNDMFGHDGTDMAIKAYFSGLREQLERLQGVHFFMYRPQAGGDEMKILMFAPQDENKDTLEIVQQKILNYSYHHQGEWEGKQQEAAVTATVGYSMYPPESGGDEPQRQVEGGKILEKLEATSEEMLAGKKMKKIEQDINETIRRIQGRGNKVEMDSIIDIIVSDWGVNRIGEKVLRAILNYVVALSVRRTISQGGRFTTSSQ